MTKEELSLPANHLRACDISDQSESLCGVKDQNDVTTQESLQLEARASHSSSEDGPRNDLTHTLLNDNIMLD